MNFVILFFTFTLTQTLIAGEFFINDHTALEPSTQTQLLEAFKSVIPIQVIPMKGGWLVKTGGEAQEYPSFGLMDLLETLVRSQPTNKELIQLVEKYKLQYDQELGDKVAEAESRALGDEALASQLGISPVVLQRLPDFKRFAIANLLPSKLVRYGHSITTGRYGYAVIVINGQPLNWLYLRMTLPFDERTGHLEEGYTYTAQGFMPEDNGKPLDASDREAQSGLEEACTFKTNWTCLVEPVIATPPPPATCPADIQSRFGALPLDERWKQVSTLPSLCIGDETALDRLFGTGYLTPERARNAYNGLVKANPPTETEIEALSDRGRLEQAEEYWMRRHGARVYIRDRQDFFWRWFLNLRDQIKYGQEDGPTFRQSLAKYLNSSSAQMLSDVSGSAQRTNADYNKRFSGAPGS